MSQADLGRPHHASRTGTSTRAGCSAGEVGHRAATRRSSSSTSSTRASATSRCPILEAMARYGKTCTGEYGWAAIPHIQAIIAAARAAGQPVIYTIPQDPRQRPTETLQRFEEKMPNWNDYRGQRDGYAFADEIAPEPGRHRHREADRQLVLPDRPRGAPAGRGHRLPGRHRRRDERVRAGDRRRRPRPRASRSTSPRTPCSTAGRSPTP